MENSQVDNVIKDLEKGDKAAARAQLRELLLHEPENETGWLLFARAARTREQASYCLERVLRLDPDNQTALAWLKSLSQSNTGSEQVNLQTIRNAPEEASLPVFTSENPAEPDVNPHQRISQRLEALFTDLDAAPDPAGPGDGGSFTGWTWECDPQGKYRACSAGVETWLGVAPENFAGKPLASYRLVARSRKDVASLLQSEAESAEIAVTYIRSNGDTLRGRLHITPVSDENGKILGWRGFTEIVDRKQTPFDAESISNRSEQAPNEVTERITLCPFLGFVGDPQTCYTYPHPANSCLRQSHPISVKTSYQESYCLTEEHVNCPIFKGEVKSGKEGTLTGIKKRWKPRFWRG